MVLPFRSNPISGESLTSYLQRLAQENVIPAHELWRQLLLKGKHYPQTSFSHTLNSDLPRSLDLKKLEQFTLIPVEKISNMTFRPVIKKLVENVEQLNACSSRILSCQLENNLKYCPHCLKESQHYKLIWQVKEIDFCPVHQVRLVGRCPSCNSQIPFLAKDSIVGICPTCNSVLSKVIDIADKVQIQGQERIISDWTYLLNPNNIMRPQVPGLDFTQGLAAALIYIRCGQVKEYKREDLIHSGPDLKTITILLQTARGTRVGEHHIHIGTILSVLRLKGISCEEFSGLKLPESFLRTLLGKPLTLKESFSCLAPWCKNYGKPGSLEKTGTTKIITDDGKHLQYYMYCKQCFVEYAIDAQNKRLMERGYFTTLAWKKVRPLLLEGQGIKHISRCLGETTDRILRCTMYLVANNLVHQDIADKFSPKHLDSSGIEKLKTAITNGININAFYKNSDWGYREFLYYRFLPEVRRIEMESKIPRTDRKADETVRKQKVINALNELVYRKEKITIAKVCNLVGVNHESLRLWGMLPLIKEFKSQQNIELLSEQSDEWFTKADQVFEDLQKNKINIYSATVYEKLGIRRTVLVRKFPEVTTYIAERLKQNRQSEHQEKLQWYVETAKEVVARKIQEGTPYTQLDLASEVGLSLSGFQRYPKLVSVWHGDIT